MKEKIAENIIDRFFDSGARVGKEHYDYILSALDEIERKTLEGVTIEVEGIENDEVETNSYWIGAERFKEKVVQKLKSLLVSSTES